MNRRTRVYIVLIGVLGLAGMLSVSLFSLEVAAQIDPTDQQATIDAVVHQYFTQTAAVQQQFGITQTIEAAFAAAQTSTAAFQGTLQAGFNQALTATAGFDSTVQAAFQQAITTTAQASLEAHLTDISLGPISADNASQVVELARIRRGTFRTSAWSPNGRVLAIGGSLGTWLYQVDTPEAPPRLLPGRANQVRFTPDGSRLVSWDDSYNSDHIVRIWDVDNGNQIGESGNLAGILTFNAELTPQGLQVASVAREEDNSIHLWNGDTKTEIAILRGHSGRVTRLDFSPDGSKLLSTSRNEVRLWNTESGNEIASLDVRNGYIRTIAFSSDGRLLATTPGNEDIVEIWDLSTGAKQAEYVDESPTDLVSLQFSPDGTRLASIIYEGLDEISGTSNLLVRLWDTETGNKLFSFRASGAIVFSPDGTELAVKVANKVLILDSMTGAELIAVQSDDVSLYPVAYNPDGKTLVLSRSNGIDVSIQLWDIASNELVSPLDGFSSTITDVVFSPNGAYLASAGYGGVVWLRDPATGTKLFSLEGNGPIAFSPDGTKLAVVDYIAIEQKRLVRLWDVETKNQQLVIDTGHTGINNLAFTPNGTRLASAGREGAVRIWDVQTGDMLVELEGHTDQVLDVVFSSDGTRVWTASYDNMIRLWDANAGIEIRSAQQYGVSKLALSPDETRLATNNGLLDAAIGEEVFRFQGGNASDVAFSPDGRYVASADYRNQVRLWDVKSGMEVASFSGHTDYVSSVAFSPDGLRIASGSYDGTIRIWGVPKGEQAVVATATASAWTPTPTVAPQVMTATAQAQELQAQIITTRNVSRIMQLSILETDNDGIRSLSFNPDSTLLVSGYDDQYTDVMLWDLNTGQSRRLEGHTWDHIKVAFSPDGSVIASAADDTVRLWRGDRNWEGTVILEVPNVTSVAFNSAGTLIAGAESISGTGRAVVKLWDVQAGSEIASLRTSEDVNAIVNIAFSPDGEYLVGAISPVSFTSHYYLQVWSLSTRSVVYTIESLQEYTSGLAFSPDGRILVSASHDGTIKIWDGTIWGSLRVLQNEGAVTGTAFSPDGSILAASGVFGIRLWDTSTWRILSTFPGGRNGTQSVAFSPDGRFIASGEYGAIRLWGISPY